MKETEVQFGRNDSNPLTLYQMEELKLAAMGLSNKEIAEKSHTAVDTVSDTFKLIYEKLKVNGTYQALVLAINSGWLDPEQCVGESNPSLFENLTSQQLDVVKLVAMGKTNDEISEELSYSRSSISNGLTKVYSCLEIKPGDNSRKKGRVAVLYNVYRRMNNV